MPVRYKLVGLLTLGSMINYVLVIPEPIDVATSVPKKLAQEVRV